LNNSYDEEDKILLGEITDASKNASRLTKQLLAIWRKNVIHLKLINTNRRLKELKEIFQRLLGSGSDISIILNLDPDCGNIYVDMGLLDQMLVNFVLNARDAMPNGGSLEISTKKFYITEKNNHLYPDAKIIGAEYTCISIKDTGIGMSKEVQNHLFEPFFTTKQRGEGTGLGLSMAYNTIKQFQGFITVESTSGVGSCFTIYIPSSDQKDTFTEKPISLDFQRGNRELILVVEDEAAVRSTIIGMLKRLNYEVISFGNGFEAIKYFKKNEKNIDLLFTDIVMKGLKGNELANELKKLNPNLKVLFASGYTDKVIAKYGVLYKDTHFIAKPFSFDMLAEKIHEILNK
jgi:CheY-like chemotaxis protein